MSYDAFEGTIPAGRYGGDTVMLWDRGATGGARHWLLVKRADEHAMPGFDVVAGHPTSVVTRRTMEEIATDRGSRR